MDMSRKKVFIDIDGVIADFIGHFFEYYNIPDKSPPTAWADERIVDNFHRCEGDQDFWLSMPALIDPMDINFRIDGYCTSRTGCCTRVTEEWIVRNGFPIAPVFTVNGDKAETLIREEVDIFVDDAIHNYEELNNAGIRTYLLTTSYNNNYPARFRVDNLDEFSVFAKTSVLIVGHKRHGKTTAAEMIREIYGLSFSDSSFAASEIFIYETLKEKYGYSSPDECFEDRVNHRSEWFDLICEYNEDDPFRLSKNILMENDIYVGMRSKRELDACRVSELFDIIIGIYDDRKELEPKNSFDFDVFDADIVIDNSGTLKDLHHNIETALDDLLLEKVDKSEIL